MRPLLIAAPAIEPVSLADAKAWLREDANDEDALIQTLIAAARMSLEAATRRFFVTQSWRLIFDTWPCSTLESRMLAIPFAPFQSVTEIRWFDAGDGAHIIDAATYRASMDAEGGRIFFRAAPAAALRETDAIEIDFTVGYGAAANATPEPLRRALLILVAHWRENRGDADERALPPAVARLVAPFRRERLI